MEPLLKNRFLLLGVLLTVLSTTTPAFASGEIVSASDAQHFEQTYEDWAKSLIKSLNPKLDFTVLTQIEFSKNPQHLQEYEDMKAANHLPGLPEVADPSYTNPLDSPLYALVAKKQFKVIVYSQLTQTEIDLVREVLNSKLKLNGDDALNFEYINRETSTAPQASPKHPVHASKTAIETLIAGLVLLAGAAFSMRKNGLAKFNPNQIFNRASKSSTHATPSSETVAQPPQTNPTLSAAHQIQMATPATLRKVLETENAELIARASLNATKKFSNRILGECEQGKFDLVIQWINANHKNVSHNDSNYARLLLAARIQQISNEYVLNSIDAFNKARDLKTKAQGTKTSFKIVRSPEVNEAKL
jgi:hypothetical protein